MTARRFAPMVFFFLAACSDADTFINAQLSRLVANSKDSTIDLSGIGPRGWERLCFIEPYATNQITKQVLGFDWDSERKSTIGRDDGMFLLVFTSGKRVLAFAEYPRDRGDFARRSVSCVSPADAHFRKEVDSKGWIFLVHQPAATFPT
jgi:hypothetical protein